MSRYTLNLAKTSLPSHCEKIAEYWAELVCFEVYASGRAAGMKYKAVRAFRAGLREAGLSDEQVHLAYCDTLELRSLKKSAE
jgi:hypothetical protein